jgi:hypothetical protein
MDRADYEWYYYIGGDMGLKRRKYGGTLAYVHHHIQGQYEAVISREETQTPWTLGIFSSPDEAQEAVEQVLQPLWEKKNESTSTVCRMD